MTRHSVAGLAAFAAALLLVSAVVVTGAAVAEEATQPGSAGATQPESDEATPTVGDAATGDPPDGASTEGAVATPPTRCFAGEGYPISIGETGATIHAVVHLSVLTDPAAGNEFGVEAAGALDGEPIVTLAAGVRLTAREAISDGVDPFAAFDVLYAYELTLPMFGGAIGDSEYRDDGSPIESGAGAAAC